MGLTVHVGQRTDRLADGLAQLLSGPSPDPFAEDVVVVPAKGVERWLTQRLSHRLGAQPGRADGICAGVRFLNPASLVVLLTGAEASDPWDPDRLVWSVLRVVDACLDEPWCRTLARHLGHHLSGDERDLRMDRRWSVARRLAGLFASYAAQRPQLIEDWTAGADLDGAGSALDADLRWQAQLWRRVVADVGAPVPTERHRRLVAAIADGASLQLPDRLSLFGHTRLTPTDLDLVYAVATVREVHLWLPTASPQAWQRLDAALAGGPDRRRLDTSATLVAHPLLATLGRDSRELCRSLRSRPGPPGDAQPSPAVVDEESDPSLDSLLGWLQHDLRTDSVPDARTRAARAMRTDDRSVEVHATHGRQRQVEVLRELVTGALQDDPTLQPRDVLVMCPDVEVYAPLVTAAFGLGSVLAGGHPAHQLRVQLADRAPSSTNPLLAVAADLVTIAAGRATLTQVLQLASAPPVRRRFGFTDDELSTAATWARDAGVRWGLSADLRRPYQLERFGQNTWAAGLDRLLVGVTMAEGERLVGDVLPLDDVPSAAVDLAGRLAELVARVGSCVESFLASEDVGSWLDALLEAVTSVASAPPSEVWQLVQFERIVADLRSAATARATTGSKLRLADLRAMLEYAGRPRPTRASFRAGALTVCTMVPMRSVPHRLVCLMGLEDGSFPRVQSTDGDDVLARDPLTAERDLRSEDRQLLLDAVMAATDRLVVTYTGANPVAGQEHPPSVPLGELLDALDATADGPVREQVLVRHPLQPYDARNTTPGALCGTEAFSFDVAALRGADAAAAPARAPVGLLPRPLSALPVRDLALADLQALVSSPARAFLRQRLDIALPQDGDEPSEAIPLELDELAQWEIGDRIVRRLLDGIPAQAVYDAELRRGRLPPAALGDPVFLQIGRRAVALVSATAALRQHPAAALDVVVPLAPGRRLVGTVPDVRADRVVRVSYAALGARHRLAAWVDLLCLAGAYPDRTWTALTIGWDARAGAARASELGPLEADPTGLLRDVVDLYDAGMCEPLPIPPRTAYAWAEAARRDKDPWPAARRAWEGGEAPDPRAERCRPEHVLVYGADSELADLTDPPRRPGSLRLGPVAVRLWDPLFEHERVRRV
ncbi:MAG: exodeoxyribonuclease V subunit gamma [Dermatophilaceae bacterium]